MRTFTDVDAYIAAQPEALRDRLEALRKIIRAAAPDAEECISYGMPAFKYFGPLVYFGAFKNHIGFFPTGSGVQQFVNELDGFIHSKGTIQLLHSQPIPDALIRKITRFRVQENEAKAALKKKKISPQAHPKEAASLPIEGISAPARRALDAAGIKSLKGLARYTEAQLLDLHGLGPSAIPRIRKALEEAGLRLKG